MRLVLWDIDGTLVRIGDLGRDPFESAIAAVLARDLDSGFHERVQMSGKTDPQIARELLLAAEVAEGEVDRHLPEVLRGVEAGLLALEHRMQGEGRAMPGAAAVLERLAGSDSVLQSVLTGNLAANALVKLRAFGLDRFVDLDVGAYGSDHHDRDELVPIALAKASGSRPDETFGADDTWIVGDTPRDLACARAGGARCALVATGRFSVDDLRALGADAVLSDLSDTDGVVALLTG
ncbi:MAG TPA: HAD hydrolase-like protein [Acidimicrobiales bacterium]|nr:HAD hydrolase-like protein [Acidimicrobiales bacterium]